MRSCDTRGQGRLSESSEELIELVAQMLGGLGSGGTGDGLGDGVGGCGSGWGGSGGPGGEGGLGTRVRAGGGRRSAVFWSVAVESPVMPRTPRREPHVSPPLFR
jgi:hypothetical protein